jgi:hypothetical protein
MLFITATTGVAEVPLLPPAGLNGVDLPVPVLVLVDFNGLESNAVAVLMLY